MALVEDREKSTKSQMLIGQGQESECGCSMLWSVKLHSREWRRQSKGMSKWGGRGDGWAERPGVRIMVVHT